MLPRPAFIASLAVGLVVVSALAINRVTVLYSSVGERHPVAAQVRVLADAPTVSPEGSR